VFPERAQDSINQIDEAGKTLQIINTMMDMSEQETALCERKLAEVALDEANQDLAIVVEEQVTELIQVQEQLQTEIAKCQETSKLEAILQMLPDLYFRLDANGTILNYKPGKTQNLDNLPEIVQGKRLLEYLPPDVGIRFQQAINQVLETKVLVSFEYILPLSAGNGNFEARLLPLQEQQIIVLVRDISDRMQPALIENDLKFRTIVENANNIIFALTLEGVFSYVSPNWTDILGHEVAEVEGKSFVPFMHPDDVPMCADYFQRVLTTGEKQNAIEYRLQHKDGSWRWHTSNSSAIKDANGNFLYFAGICHDITEQQAALRDRKQAQEALAERARLADFRADVDAALAQSQNLQCMIRRCTEALVKHIDAAFARLWILNKEENVLELQVSSGMYTHIDGPHRRVPVGQFKIGLIAEEGKPHLTNSVLTDPRVGNKEWAKREGMVAFAGYPLIIEGETVGVIAMFSRRVVTESTFIALEFAAQDIAISIKRKQAEKALLASEAKYRAIAQREALLNRLASQIRASLELNYILETAVQEIRNLFQIDRCAFFWYRQNAEPPYWECVYEAKNPSLPSLLESQATYAEVELIATKILNREIIRLDDVKNVGDGETPTSDEHTAQQFLHDFGFTAFISLPVHTQSGEIGAFSCGYCSGFRPWLDNEVDLLEAVTVQLAIAIDQAKLYTQSRIAAHTAQEKAQQLEEALLELQQTQAQLIQTEKMSSLGQLVAGIAHEINNPVNFIYGNISHASEYVRDLLHLVELYQRYCPPIPEIKQEIQAIDLDFLTQDLSKILHSMNIGAERIRQIVLSLRNFSRLDEDGMKRVDIHEGIDSTLLLLQSRLKAKPEHPEIQVIQEYGNLPQIVCHAGQMNQVFMNILNNAIDAVEESTAKNPELLTKPQIRIRTLVQEDKCIIIRIADNGSGMTEEVCNRLFDPFFTTKPVGKGTGMGLSISYQIVVKNHRGQLQCISAPGEGAEFVITIPLQQQPLLLS